MPESKTRIERPSGQAGQALGEPASGVADTIGAAAAGVADTVSAGGGRSESGSGSFPSMELVSQVGDVSLSSAAQEVSVLARQEHLANLIRMRRAITYGVVFWPLFALVDVAAALWVGLGHLGYLLALRFAVVPYYIFLVWRIRRQPDLNPLQLRLVDLSAFGTAIMAITLMSIRIGGFHSIYFAGVIVAIVCRGAFVAEPLGPGMLAAGFEVGVWALTLLGSCWFVPEMAEQFRHSSTRAVFAVQFGFIASTAVLVALGGNAFWSLRRKVFSARNIGRYRLKERIGKGGMGEVWSAWHAALRKNVAVKLLRPDSFRDTDAIQRFEREVAATAELVHPNTIRVFDYGVTEDGIWYYVMELLEGEDLASLVEREGALSEERALKIALQASRALAEAHARGIVHRDIKPENIYLTKAGLEEDLVKVLDFGIAKVSGTMSEGGTLTRTGVVVGTPAYMSPEAARGQPVDARSDVYGLGAVLYYMLTARPPFQGEGMAELLMAHLSQAPDSVSGHRSDPVLPATEQVVARCLEKDPDFRYEDASALADELENCLFQIRRSG